MRARTNKLPAVFVLFIAGLAALFLVAVPPVKQTGAADAANPATLYRYFENPSAVCADGSSVYVADGSAVFTYSPALHEFSAGTVKIGANESSPQDVLAMAAGGGRLYVAEGSEGALAAYTISNNSRISPNYNPSNLPVAPAPASGYSSVAVLNGSVFAANHRSVHIFNDAFEYRQSVSTAAAEDSALGLTAGKNQVFAALGRESSFYIRALTAESSGTLPASSPILVSGERFEGIAYLSGENALAVITRSRIRFYNADTLEPAGSPLARADNASRFAGGADCFYTVNFDNSLSRISADLTAETVLAASSGGAPGFYHTPMDIASRQGKIFVADRLNNRVSVQTDAGFSAINSLPGAVSVATDADGYLYAAYNIRSIAKYAPSGVLANDPDAAPYRFAPGGVPKTIAALRADSKSNLYVLSDDNLLYKLAAKTVEFVPEFKNGGGSQGKVYGMAAGLNHAEFYIAVRANAADEHPKKILRAGENGFEPTGIENIAGFIDMAADEDGGIYILQEINSGRQIIRYDRHTVAGVTNADGSPGFAYTPNGNTVAIADSSASLRLSVSAIENGAVGYRDLLIADAARHTVKSVACARFGIRPDIPKTPPKLDGSLPAPGTTGSEQLIRTITGADGCALFAGPNDVYPVKRFTSAAQTLTEDVTLPGGYRVIVPSFDAAADYSFVIADNISYEKYGDYEILTGYVRNKFLSEPLTYTDAHPAYCMANYDEGTPVYKYPSIQSPKFEGLESVEKGTFFALKDFVRDESRSHYGYYDNRHLEYGASARWYRIEFTSGGHRYDGFVDADSVTIDGLPPLTGVQLQTNAVIIGDEPAKVYALKDGAYVEDLLHGPLPAGKRVKVDGAFDSSTLYTKVIFTTDFGTVQDRYVETAHIKYDGVNLLQPIIIGVICITLVIAAILTVRYIRNKRSRSLVVGGGG